VGKGKLFWFFSVGFVCRQKTNPPARRSGVLDRALAFFNDAKLHNGSCNKLKYAFINLHKIVFLQKLKSDEPTKKTVPA